MDCLSLTRTPTEVALCRFIGYVDMRGEVTIGHILQLHRIPSNLTDVEDDDDKILETICLILGSSERPRPKAIVINSFNNKDFERIQLSMIFCRHEFQVTVGKFNRSTITPLSSFIATTETSTLYAFLSSGVSILNDSFRGMLARIEFLSVINAEDNGISSFDDILVLGETISTVGLFGKNNFCVRHLEELLLRRLVPTQAMTVVHIEMMDEQNVDILISQLPNDIRIVQVGEQSFIYHREFGNVLLIQQDKILSISLLRGLESNLLPELSIRVGNSTNEESKDPFMPDNLMKVKSVPPARPPRPATQRNYNDSESSQTSTDAGNLRSKFHSKIFGAEVNSHASGREQTITRWIPPYKSVVQMFSEKPPIDSSATFGIDFDSDNEEEVVEPDEDDQEEKCEYAAVTSYAWLLLRLALVEQMRHQILQFLTVSGFDITDIASVAPRVDSIFRLLHGWIIQLRQSLRTFSGGCPVDIIPNMTVDNSDAHMGVTARKYASLLEAENTPFESEDARILPVKRLWAFLVREPHLQNLFIAHIYASQSQEEQCLHNADPLLRNLDSQVVPDAFKIVQREQEPIVAFACNQNKPGWLVVSNGRELQEMDISTIFEDGGNNNSWLFNRPELDVQLLQMKRDTGRDNDDYQLFSDNVDNSPKQATMMIKRTVGGIRRIDSHPSASCYVTGSTDGSIRVWEWGVGQPVYTARVAGQHAKVSKISFSFNGNKFAAVDGDGMLCLWQASQATEHKEPFFSHRCHNKYASDVRFLGQTSSVLLTAGSSTGEYNLGLWDTLLPQNRALVHSWVAHPEGATCAMYMPNQQVIVSGGKHGELCLWDVRQRQLRLTIKAFEPNQMIKTLVTDFAQDLIVAGSSEGDIKIWSADPNPQLMYALNGEHTAKGGFSFRQVSQGTIQGVQQLYIDQQMRLFSCGADAKFRALPFVYNMRLG